jgi:3-oxoacyl-[acyl-carrier protein] reductase
MARPQDRVRVHRPIVWVVGASRGIGKEIAKQFASIGCEVCLSARNKKHLDAVVGEITRLGGRARAFPCDISSVVSINTSAERIRKQVGTVDVLINNAGITVFKSFLTTTSKEFNDIISTNLLGYIFSVKAVLPSMVKRKQGWIINILSTAAVRTFPNSSAYTATKSGMLGVGKVLREELRQHGVKVVNIMPGPTETEMWSASARKKYSKRMMRAKSVAEAVLEIYRLPQDLVIEDVILGPIKGDIS